MSQCVHSIIDSTHIIFHSKEIASGNFGVVKKGVYNLDGECIPVVIKQHKVPADINQSKWYESRAREAHISHLASSSNHPNVVKFFGAYHDDINRSSFCMVYQFLSGGNAEKALLQEKRYNNASKSDVSKMLRMALDATKGIAELHRLHIIHRDIACRNLLLDDCQRVW